MKKVLKKSTENCHFYNREKSLYNAWACFRNVAAVKDSPSLFYLQFLILFDCRNRNRFQSRAALNPELGGVGCHIRHYLS